MHRLALSATLLVVCTSCSFAQAPVVRESPSSTRITQAHRGNPHKAAARMAGELGLSADQQARLEPVLAERRQKTDAVRANTALSNGEREQQLKAIHKSTRMQMRSVLTPDQLRQLKALRKSRTRGENNSPAGV